MYTMTYFGKKRQITGKQFAAAIVLALAFFVFGSIGLVKLGGWWVFLGVVLLTASVESNQGKTYAIIPHEKVRSFISGAALWVGVGYLIYNFFK